MVKNSDIFNNKTLLITGGTGSFGNAVAKKFLDSSIREIRILSRDEKKQDDMRKKYKNNKLKFYIGDVRDYSSVNNAMSGVDYIFHSAALKQVPSCEFHPMEAVKTNIIGTDNVLEAAIQNKVKKVICLSTDKAVYPINAMGISKALMEKVIVAKSRNSDSTIICGTRYGNVMASRGSVIPLFTNQIITGRPITVTNLEMTRFMMTLEEAVELVLFAFSNGKPDHEIKIIGTRHGEKKYEVLLSKEEMAQAEDLGGYYRVPPGLRDLNYGKYLDKGEMKFDDSDEYNSHNTERLNVSAMKKLLAKLDTLVEIQKGNLAAIFEE